MPIKSGNTPQLARWLDSGPATFAERFTALANEAGVPLSEAAKLLDKSTEVLRLYLNMCPQRERDIVRILLRTERHSGKEHKAPLSVQLPSSDHALMKRACALRGITVSEGMREALRVWYDAVLDEHEVKEP